MSIQFTNIYQAKTNLSKLVNLYFESFEYTFFSITLSHIQELHNLPLHHKDPFDRMLVAQARVEGCTLITIDKKLHAYDVPILGVNSS